MNAVYVDPNHADLVWMEFEGPTWTEYNIVLNDLSKQIQLADKTFILIFKPAVDMPQGNPIPHVKRTLKFLSPESSLQKMIIILPKRMVMAKSVLNMMVKVFNIEIQQIQFVGSHNEAMAAYQSHQIPTKLV